MILGSRGGLLAERRGLQDLVGDTGAEALIWDISHGKTLRESRSLKAYLEADYGKALRCVIDGFADSSLLEMFGAELTVDMFVIPYAGARSSVPERSPARLLSGVEFAVIEGRLRTCVSRPPHVPDVARNILITAGGSDPYTITELATEAVARMPHTEETELRIVIGPLFGRDRTRRIRELAPESAQLVIAPSNLCNALEWAHVAVSGTGLTKYELALFGVPAIFVSGDEGQEAAHEPFEELGTGFHVGVVGELDPEVVSRALGRLRTDVSERERMARNGQDSVDGRGAERVASRISELAQEVIAR